MSVMKVYDRGCISLVRNMQSTHEKIQANNLQIRGIGMKFM